MAKYCNSTEGAYKGPESYDPGRSVSSPELVVGNMQTALKARPTLARSASSFHEAAGSRAASMLASNDIFDSPGRLIFEDSSPVPPTRPTRAASRPHDQIRQPSPSRHSLDTQRTFARAAPIPSRQVSDDQPQNSARHANQARQLSTLSRNRDSIDGSVTLFNGPAKPRNPSHLISRRSASSAAPLSVADAAKLLQGQKDRFSELAMPDPVIYDGPACPPKKVPVKLRRSYDDGAHPSSSVVIGTLVGLSGLAAAYEVYEANQSSEN